MRRILIGLVVAVSLAAPSVARAATGTVVSLTFDDGRSNQYDNALPALTAHGMHGTFFIITGKVGDPGYATLAQLQALAAAGNEIGGHTVLHPFLSTDEPDEVRREICNNRSWLLSKGFAARNFSYPRGDYSAAAVQAVADCGFNSGRLAGGVWSKPNCVFDQPIDCSESLPALNPYLTRATVSIDETMTLADIEGMVTNAENTGGGWIQLVFHDVCDSCGGPYRITTANFSALLDWLQARAANGTVVKTVDEAVGGTTKPAVAGPAPPPPPPAGTNMFRNPSLETGPVQSPLNSFAAFCWPKTTNSPTPATWTRTTDAHNGAFAERVDVSSIEDWGYEALVPTQDLGACAPPATPGHVYRFTGWYKSTAPVNVISFVRSTESKWRWLRESDQFPAAANWTRLTFTLPAMPADAEGVSAGFWFNQVGSLTMDDLGLVDTSVPDTTPPVTSFISAPPGTVATKSATFAFDSSDPGSTFECSLDGGTWSACSSPLTLTGLADGSRTFRVRATDPAAHVEVTPASRTWVVDTTPPDTVISSGPASLSASSAANFSFSSTEGGSHFDCSLDGASYTSCTSPAGYSGLTDAPHTFSVRAADAVGNVDATPATRNWTVDTTAPTTTVTGGPPALTSSTTASFTLASSEDGSFECSLDGAAFAACTSPAAYTVADGDHTFSARAVDLAGNADATPEKRTWTVDHTPPVANLSSDVTSPTNATSASFTFSSSEPGSSFECSLDDAAFGTCTSPSAYSNLGDGPHTFAVHAIDQAGNVGEATRAWTVDTVAPVTTISSGPADPAHTTTATFAFASSESGATYECSLDGAPWAACTSPATYDDLPDGLHTFAVRATDLAGNLGADAERSWTVAASDHTSPTVALVQPVAGGLRRGHVAFTATADDDVGVARVEFLVDGSVVASDTSAPYEASWSSASHADGQAVVTARAVDTSDNATTSAARTIVVDNTPPETIIASGPSGVWVSNSAAFELSATEPGSKFECALDAAAFAPCGSPASYTALSDGPHAFAVRATDGAGNVDPTPAHRSWSVDTRPVSSVSIGDVAVRERDARDAIVLFPVSVSPATPRPATVAFATVDGSAIAPLDYAATSGTLSSAAGESVKTIAVRVHGDFRRETRETFTLQLSAPVDVTLTRARGTATILDNDLAPSARTQAARSEIGSALLRGLVDPNGKPTRFFFEYGPTKRYGERTRPRSAGSARAMLRVGALVATLRPGARYHARLVAMNATGTTRGADVSFVPRRR